MSMPRVLVVEHDQAGPVGLVGERLRAAGCLVQTVGPDAGVPVPRTPDGVDGVIVLGGPMGPTDDDVAPWLPDVRALLSACLREGRPVLAICLGAELLAHVAGGVVGRIPAGPEIGLTRVRPLPAAAGDLVLGRMPQDAEAVQWHSLEASALPAEAVVLATSDRCANQAFRIGDAAWGVQFHPEVDAAITAVWAANGPADLAEAGLDAPTVVGAVRDAEERLRATWAALADDWIAVVRRVSRDAA